MTTLITKEGDKVPHVPQNTSRENHQQLQNLHAISIYARGYIGKQWVI